jgi:hypothetical protein
MIQEFGASHQQMVLSDVKGKFFHLEIMERISYMELANDKNIFDIIDLFWY